MKIVSLPQLPREGCNLRVKAEIQTFAALVLLLVCYAMLSLPPIRRLLFSL